MDYILLQIVAVPLAAAPAIYMLSGRLKKNLGWVAGAVLLYTTLLTLIASYRMPYVEEFSWYPIGIFGLKADGLSIPILFTIGLLTAVIAIYSIPYMEHKIGDKTSEYGTYFALYLFYAVGMMGTVLATNLIEFYLFFELMLIPSYFLIAQWGYGEREKISFMYFMWTHIGALFLLAGILSVGYLAGNFDLSVVAASIGGIAETTRVWIAVAMTVGLLVKMAAFGLHVWLPHAHAEAPTPISALLSPAMIGIGGYALVRLVVTLLPSAFETISFALAVWALVTMIYGGAMALVQDDIKRLLAYSSISQMGYIMLGISSAYSTGVIGSMFHYVSHGTGKGILFMTAGAIILQTHGLRSIARMGGLATKMPITAIAAIIGFMSILGAPPFNGFISEVLIFAGVFQAGILSSSTPRLVLGVLGLTATALTVGYALWTIRRVFFGPLPDHLSTVREPPLSVTIPLLTLAFVAIALGIYPSLMLQPLGSVVSQLVPGG